MAGFPQVAVVDSSVIVKLLSEEMGSEEAFKLAERHAEGSLQLWATDIIYAEVANALRFKPEFNPSRLEEAIGLLFDFDLRVLATTAETLSRAGKIAYDAGITIYDALPVAVAETKSAKCITADNETQYERLKPRGYPVELL